MYEISEAWASSFNNNDIAAVADLLSDDEFVFAATNLPHPLTKVQWLELIDVLNRAFSDLQFNWKASRSEGLTYQITGTHDGTLALSMLGLGDFPASGKTVSLPEDNYHVTITNGKITRIDVDPVPGGGLGGILDQLGFA